MAVSLEQELREENSKVADWLLNYEDRKLEHQERQRRITVDIPPQQYNRVGGRGSNISDPTAAAAMRLGSDFDIPHWLQLVEEVERRLPPKMLVYLRLRRKYKDHIGRKGWIASLQQEYADEVSKLTGKQVEVVWIDSRKTFWRWWARIVEFAARLAAKKGLI